MSNAVYSSFPSTIPSADENSLAVSGLGLTPERSPERQIYPKTTQVWETPFALVDMAGALQLAADIVQARKPEYFVTANLNYLMLVEQFPLLAEVNRRAAAVLADGHPIVARSRCGSNPLPCRVAGSDLILELARLCAERGYRMFLLGAAEGVAAKAAAELQVRNPKLQIAGCYCPPFRPLSSAETDDLIRQVNGSQADILLVALGQPKGELWIYEHLPKLRVPLSIQLGASFDFLAGTAKRAPAVWQRWGLEWMYRALSDPQRLGPRYAANLYYLTRRLAADACGFFSSWVAEHCARVGRVRQV